MINENELMTKQQMIEKVKSYLQETDRTIQAEAVQTIKKLLKQGRSPLWVYMAMTNNKISDINRYGFSSVSNAKVIERVTNKVQTYIMAQSENPWEILEDDEG